MIMQITPMPMPMPIHSSGCGDKISTLEMMWFFLIITFVCNIIILLLTRITYEKRYNACGPWVRFRHPIWFYLIIAVSWLFPIGNGVIAFLNLCIYIARGCGDWKDYQIGKRNFLNKKI